MNKLEALEMYVYRRIGKIPWKQKKTNAEVLNIVGVKQELKECIKTRKLKYYGHLMRHDSFLKQVLDGTAEGNRGRGIPRTKWSDISEWTGESVVSCQRLAQNRCQWRVIATNLQKKTAHR